MSRAAARDVDRGTPGASWALVWAAQEGSTDAFALIYQKYRSRVLGYLVVRVRDVMIAEDLTSETFLRAFRSLSSVSYMGKGIGAWLITIARNLASDFVGSARYRNEVLTGALAEQQLVQVGPEEEVIRKCEFEQVSRYFQYLSRDQRECIELRFLKQLSVAEAAHRMDRKENAARALQMRAVRRLSTLCADGAERPDLPGARGSARLTGAVA